MSCERGDVVRVGKVERSVREGVVRVRRERKGVGTKGLSIRVERERGREIDEVRTWGERCRSESMGRERGSEREKEWG